MKSASSNPTHSFDLLNPFPIHSSFHFPLFHRPRSLFLSDLVNTNSNPPFNPSAPFGEENSPVKPVALTVPVTDDPTLPIVTFRLWVLGSLACVLLSFLNQFFWVCRELLSISSISAQIAVVPLGHLMASFVTKRVFFKGRRWEFSLNLGPFNIKEHVLITIFANSGASNPYSIHIVSAVKVFYKNTLTFWVALVVVLTT